MRKRGTKDRVLDAAVRLFNDRGTAAVSTNHVAREAGISPGNLYYHFGNKEEIVREILERMIVEWGEVWTIPEGRGFDLGLMRSVLEENFALQWKYRFFYRESIALMRRDPELARRYADNQRRRIEEQTLFLEGFVEAGIMSEPEDPAELGALVKTGWIVATGWLSFLETGGEGVGPEKMREGVDLIARILRPYLTDGAALDPDGALARPGDNRP